MKITTKKGDKGETGLFDGGRVGKGSDVMEVIGGLDELSAWLGMCKVSGVEEAEKVQDDLWQIMGEVSGGGAFEVDLKFMEEVIGSFSGGREFVRPGKDEKDARVHVARTICRRVERDCVRLGVRDEILQYMNRLSDYLFVIAHS